MVKRCGRDGWSSDAIYCVHIVLIDQKLLLFPITSAWNHKVMMFLLQIAVSVEHKWYLSDVLLFTDFILLQFQKQPPEVISDKKVFLKISQISQESTCLVHLVCLSNNKNAAFRPAALLKRDWNTDAFLWNLRNFKEHLFWRTSANDCCCIVEVMNAFFYSNVNVKRVSGKLPPRKIAPRLRLAFGLGLGLVLGLGANFPWVQLS